VAGEDLGINYVDPPVVEVVAAASFQRLPDLALPVFGGLWEASWYERFPKVEQQPPYPAPVERFDAGGFTTRMALQFGASYPAPRFWFLSSEGDELLQLQQDWFACNWRKVEPGSKYDRWPARRAAFKHWYGSLDEHVRSRGMDPLHATQCEVTYINHVYPGPEWKDHRDLGRITRLVGSPGDDMPLDLEQGRFGYQFLMKNEAGQPYGRLHITAQPAYAGDGSTPIYVIELTARGAPATPDLDGVLSLLDKGRDAIVRGFASVMTSSIQSEWGRHDG